MTMNPVPSRAGQVELRADKGGTALRLAPALPPHSGRHRQLRPTGGVTRRHPLPFHLPRLDQPLGQEAHRAPSPTGVDAVQDRQQALPTFRGRRMVAVGADRAGGANRTDCVNRANRTDRTDRTDRTVRADRADRAARGPAGRLGGWTSPPVCCRGAPSRSR